MRIIFTQDSCSGPQLIITIECILLRMTQNGIKDSKSHKKRIVRNK